jgi:large subunit ribosomal protein L24
MTVRKGDTVVVIAGKDRGKRGTVDRVEATKRGLGVVVPGLNMAKRHMRPRTRTQQAGILDLPVPIHISNVQVVCPRCEKPTRIGTQVLGNGQRVRVCKHCGEQIEGATR